MLIRDNSRWPVLGSQVRTRLPLARRSSEHSAASEIWLLCLCDIHEFELAFVASDAGESAREAVGDCVDALALVLAALLRPQSLHLPPQHGTRGRSALGCRSRAISSCGSSARGPAFSGFAARSSPLCPTTARRPAQPPSPSSSAAALMGIPNNNIFTETIFETRAQVSRTLSDSNLT